MNPFDARHITNDTSAQQMSFFSQRNSAFQNRGPGGYLQQPTSQPGVMSGSDHALKSQMSEAMYHRQFSTSDGQPTAQQSAFNGHQCSPAAGLQLSSLMPFKTQASFPEAGISPSRADPANNKAFKPTFVMPFAGQ